jgi:hypothetical protein
MPLVTLTRKTWEMNHRDLPNSVTISYTHMGNEADLLAGYNEDHLPMAVGCGLWLVYP